MRLFHDRADAGRQLAERLSAFANRNDVLVLGLPRGGVPVAYEVASRLVAPLDVFLALSTGRERQHDRKYREVVLNRHRSGSPPST